MNIGNIHTMRDSWQRLMSIAKSSYEGGDDYRWCSDLENTGWLKVRMTRVTHLLLELTPTSLKHIKLILKATLEMVKYMEINNSSVVVHWYVLQYLTRVTFDTSSLTRVILLAPTDGTVPHNCAV